MCVKGQPLSHNYILPICGTHNQQSDLECVGNHCPRYVKTKKTAALLGVLEKSDVHRYQQNDEVYQRARDFKQRKGLKSIRSHSELRAVHKTSFHKKVYIFFTMDGCFNCEQLVPRVRKYAARVQKKGDEIYLVNEKLLTEDYIDEFGIEGYPTILCIHKGRRSEDVTDAVRHVR